MAGKRRRRFGNVRKLPSGKWQARYRGGDGLMRTAPRTFDTQRDAADWLTLTESEIIRGDWIAPEIGQVELLGYAAKWIAERKLAPRTREAYEDLNRLYIAPYLGRFFVNAIKPATIRTWRKRLLDEGKSEPQAVKAYSLLRAIFSTAVKEDEIVRVNPCRIKGYDSYHTPERPTATVAQVLRLADAMPARFRAFIIVAALSALRWGELVALRRSDVDLDGGTLRVRAKLAALRNRLEVGPPKSAAGARRVTLPATGLEALRAHLAEFVDAHAEAVVFTGERGAFLRSGNFRRAVGWAEAVRAAGLPEGFHFHDLRHTGNDLAAVAGASTRELMHRMGHSSMRAALIYQHRNDRRDREIADEMDRRLKERQHDDQGDDDQGDGLGVVR